MDQPTDAPTATRAVASSSAAHVIAGFRYQLLQSISALVSLRDDEELLLEVSEDFTIVAEDATTDVQVKNSQAAKGPRAFSLQSPEVAAVLQRFWTSSKEATLNRRLVFLARGGAAGERDHVFPGTSPGLVYWRAAAMDADTQPLRSALINILPDSSLRSWLISQPDDAELRSRLLRRVQWELNSHSAEQLVIQLRDQIGELFYARNLPIMAAAQAVRALTDLAFETAGKPNEAERHLNRRDLVRTMEEAAAALLLGQQIATAPPAAAVVSQNILVSELDDVSSLIARRSDTVDELMRQTTGQPLIWIHGANGVGKSTLARLIAHQLGGRWLELDLRPVQRDAAGSLAAWRELARAIALSSPADGIIIDDFDGEGAIALRARLSALSQAFGSRGARVIVTSHHQPSAAVLLECGSAATAAVQAPYFSEQDVMELVGAPPAPDEEMIHPWSVFIRLTTGGGHPLLVAAKISSLRARGWPTTALVEDILGEPSEAVRLSRDEGRRTLLNDLAELDQARSLAAGQLLRRIGCVFDRVEDGLIRQLAIVAPSLPNSGDALAVLRGTWLEQLPGGDLRISPLLADIGADVPPDQARDWRRLAAEYWLSKRTLDARTLPLCFWNAFWGDHSGVLMVLCNTIQTMPKEQLRAAAALLSPMTALTTERSFYSSNPAVAVQLRLLQFDVADAVEDGALAAKIARRLIQEITAIEHQDLVALITHIATTRILMAEFAEITAAERISYALTLRTVQPQVRTIADDSLPDPATLLPPQFKPGMDVADLLFSMITRHIRNSADAQEAFMALDAISTRDRDGFLDAMSAIFDGHSVFVHSGWARDQLEERDMTGALKRYDEIAQIAAKWSRPDIEVEIACARSVILDEGLKQHDQALTAIDEAVSRHGPVAPLVRQKSKVLAHAGRDSEAVVLLLQVEDEVGIESPFDRALALRDGALSAARSSRFDDAIRLLDKALASAAAIDRPYWAAGLLIERSLILWRAGRRSEALLVAADALDAVEHFSPQDSRQAERSHQYARALVGLFFSEVEDDEHDKKPPFTFGDASALETDTANLVGANLRPLADNWRILATVEASIEADLGIDKRSMSKQIGQLVGTTEMLLLKIRYENAVRSRVISDSLRAGVAAISAAKALKEVPRNGDGLQRIAASQLTAIDAKVLAQDLSVREMVESLLLDTMVHRVFVESEALSTEFLAELQAASEAAFGEVSDLARVIEAGSANTIVGSSSPLSMHYAKATTIPQQSLENDPSLRFYRDMMMTGRIATSFARETMAPAFTRQVASGWRHVLDQQRFMLRNPSRIAPEMESILEGMRPPTLAKIAALLLAVAPAVHHAFGAGWMELLNRVASGTRSNSFTGST